MRVADCRIETTLSRIGRKGGGDLVVREARRIRAERRRRRHERAERAQTTGGAVAVAVAVLYPALAGK